MPSRRSARTTGAPVPAPAPALPIAGVGRRLSSLVYDGFLLFGLWVVPLFAVMFAMHAADPPQQLGGVVHELPPIASPWVIRLYAVAVVAAFYIYFWRRNGQTLAMQAWRIRLDSVDGGRPSWRQCIIRLAVGAVSLLCLGLGYFWLWWDPERRTWHDRASRTRVVQLPKQ